MTQQSEVDDGPGQGWGAHDQALAQSDIDSLFGDSTKPAGEQAQARKRRSAYLIHAPAQRQPSRSVNNRSSRA